MFGYRVKYIGHLRTFWKNIKVLSSLIGLEAFIWISGLAYLLIIHIPEATHFTICPLASLGIEFCPGCGLGNSIAYLFRGDFIHSFQTHPLGIFALAVILIRIFTIIKNNRRRYA